MSKRPPWMTVSAGDDDRSRELRSMTPDERLARFEQACELATAMLRERGDAHEVLQRRVPLSEASEASWRKIVREGRGARAAVPGRGGWSPRGNVVARSGTAARDPRRARV